MVGVALTSPAKRRDGAPRIKYVNRLSDFLFVAGRHANDDGATDVLWAAGQESVNRARPGPAGVQVVSPGSARSLHLCLADQPMPLTPPPMRLFRCAS